jgi:DNA-binding XRE family transcriptional regulator
VSPATTTTTEARTWAVTTTGGVTVRGHLPGWADNDPSSEGVLPGRLGVALADVVLEADAGGLVLPVVHGQDPAEEMGVLAVTMVCKPFGLEDEPQVPVADVQLVDDFWLKGLDPQGIADFGERLQALGHALVHQVGPALQAARDDWSGHHSPGPKDTAPGRGRSAPRVLHQEPAAVAWARKKAGLTKRALARQVGISEQLMNEIESGWRSATPSVLPRIAEALGCPVVALERKPTKPAATPEAAAEPEN